MQDGTLNTKTISLEECKDLIASAFPCQKHVNGACWLPANGECVGEHIRVDGAAQIQVILAYLVSSRSLQCYTKSDHYPAQPSLP
jgi:hypothetical protein